MSKVPLLEAVERAIATEIEARDFYLDASGKTRDAGGAAMFRELADFEDHHRSRLEALKASLEAGNGWIEYETRQLTRMPSGEASGPRVVGSHTTALEALRLAVEAEERASAEYKALAASAGDARGHRMFERLAQEEDMHRKLLDDQFSALANRGVWFWND